MFFIRNDMPPSAPTRYIVHVFGKDKNGFNCDLSCKEGCLKLLKRIYEAVDQERHFADLDNGIVFDHMWFSYAIFEER